MAIPDIEDMILEKLQFPGKDDKNSILQTLGKRKNIRKYFSRLFKEIDERLDPIPVFNVNRQPCAFRSIEAAIDLDEMMLETFTVAKKLAKALHPTTKLMLQNVGDRVLSSLSWEKVDFDVNEDSSTSRVMLEIEKCKILNEEKYNELDAGANPAAAAVVQASKSTGLIRIVMQNVFRCRKRSLAPFKSRCNAKV